MANEVHMKDAKNYSKVLKIMWRFIRTSVATAAAFALLFPVDWNDPNDALRKMSVAFVSGFTVALGKTIRNKYGKENYEGIVHKIII